MSKQLIMQIRLPFILGAVLLIAGLLFMMAPPVLATAPATITVNAPSQALNPGDSFNVTLTINNSVAVYGWQLNFTFDSTKLTFGTVTEGGFLKNNGTTIAPGAIDTSVEGVLSGICYSLTGNSNAPPGNSGLLATLSFTVKTGASGTAALGVTNIVLTDADVNAIQGVTATGASVTIGGSTSQTPAITSFNPTSGGTGTSVVITGTNFTGASAVQFGTTNAQSYTVNSATQITATVPNLGAANTTVQIKVTTSGGTATSSTSFSYTAGSSTPAPTITSFNPTTGNTGTSVVITGTNFTGATVVQFGTTNAQSYSVDSATQITAVVPDLGTDNTSVLINVTTPGGTATSSTSFAYTYSSSTTTSTAPTITGFSPLSGGNGTQVVINGTNFTNVSAVRFGGTDANDFSVNSATGITATVGSGATGPITIVTSHGTVTSFTSFVFQNGTSSNATNTPTTTPSTTPPTSSPVQTDITQNTGTQTNATVPVTVTATNTTPNTVKKSSMLLPDSVRTLDVSNYIDTGGVFQEGFEQTDIGSGCIRIARLDIKSGTRALDKDGNPLESFSVQPGIAPSQAPEGKTIICTMDFQPDGTIFSQPVEVIYEYDPAQLPKGISPDDLNLVYFDTLQSQWVPCDYTLDAVARRITARISHFSLYAILGKTGGGAAGVKWSLAGAIILPELLLGGGVIIYFLHRRRVLVPVLNRPAQTAAPAVNTRPKENTTKAYVRPLQAAPESPPKDAVVWDDLLAGSQKREAKPFKTHLIITGGKISVPGSDTTADLELINSPNSRIMISLEFDPDTHPKGLAKILILDSNAEYEKSKETKK